MVVSRRRFYGEKPSKMSLHSRARADKTDQSFAAMIYIISVAVIRCPMNPNRPCPGSERYKDEGSS
jgi:hypothetical protein